MHPRLRAGSFRGLAPYLEEDENRLSGRDRERAALIHQVTGSESPCVLITGEAGAGKTSLLRAGLIPKLSEQWLPLYVDCGFAWYQELALALSGILGRPVDPERDSLIGLIREATNARTARVVVVLDHLEQLLWLDEQSVQQLGAVLKEVLDQQGKLVFSVDQGNTHALVKLPSFLPAIPPGQRILVGRMERESAAAVMEQTVLSGGGYMEAGLPETIVNDLCDSGPVLPAELQVVGHAAAVQGVTSMNQYSRAGGAMALANLYVERLIGRSGGWRARRVLATLTEHPNLGHSLPLDSIAEGCGLKPQDTQSVLEALEREGLVHSKVDAFSPDRQPFFSIVHPYLGQPIRDAVAPVHRDRALARLSLRRRIHGRGVLRPDEIFRVWRCLGRSINDVERDQVQRATRIWTVVLGVLLGLPLLASLVIYFMLATSTYIDTAPGRPGKHRVVVRTGRPSLDFAFNLSSTSFGEVKVDTGLHLASLPGALKLKVVDNAIVGDSDLEQSALPYWFKELVSPLSPVRRGALHILAGDMETGSTILKQAADTESEREKATWALALLSGDTAQTLAALKLCAKDGRPEVRRMAVAESRRLPLGKRMAVLNAVVRDPDRHIRLAAIKALRGADPVQVLDLLASSLKDEDPRVQREVLDQLSQAAKTHPVQVFDVIQRSQQQRAARLRDAIGSELDRLLKRIQHKAPRSLADHLLTLVTEKNPQPIRVQALKRLASMTKAIQPNKALPVVTKLSSHSDPQIRAAAISLQAKFGNPEEVLPQLEEMADMARPRKEAAIMRRAAAAGLGLVPVAPNENRLKLLGRLLKDSERLVRAEAMESLVKLGPVALREVVKGIKQGTNDVADVALRAICTSPEPNRRVVTTILTAAWQANRTDLRGRALQCAKSLATANPRLSFWLAYQARADKNPQVRRGAADAVALALSQGGGSAEQLARFYLLHKDSTIVSALLEAMKLTPPRPSRSLFKIIAKLALHREAKVREAAAPLVVITAGEADRPADVLNTLLKDPRRDVWRAALEAAGKLRSGPGNKALNKTLARLVAAARSRDALVALDVSQQLQLNLPVQQAAVHPEPSVRAAAVEALARTAKSDKALSVLETALLDSEPAIRLAAIRGLGDQSERLGADAVELLGRMTWRKIPTERWAAFEALGRVRGVGVQTAERLLKKMGQHRSEQRRQLAMRALGSLAERSKEAARLLAVGAMDPALDVRTEAREALAEYLGRQSRLETLWKMLAASEQNSLLRHMAISSLAWWGRTHGENQLKELVDKLGTQTPLVVHMAARLALALTRRSDRPESVIGWLYGR